MLAVSLSGHRVALANSSACGEGLETCDTNSTQEAALSIVASDGRVRRALVSRQANRTLLRSHGPSDSQWHHRAIDRDAGGFARVCRLKC